MAQPGMTARLFTPARRRWFYGIALAAGPVLVAYGLLTADKWPLWVVLVGAVLVPGLASANIQDDPPPRHQVGDQATLAALFSPYAPPPRHRFLDDDEDGQPDTLDGGPPGR